MMRLIVGLGNPGKEYDNTRHNIGFMFLDNYLKSKGISAKWIKKFDGMLLETFINNEKIIFLKPQTYMNLSGISVRKVIDYYNIELDNLLVISDDLDLLIGNYKLKQNGSSGGHNGIKDIHEKLSSTDIKRLKIGVSNNKSIDTKEYVLGKFSNEDKNILDKLFIELNNVLDDYFKMSFGDLMAKYNKKNK